MPPELAEYALAIPLQEMHNLLANASLVYSESPTVAAEAAVLGTPSVYVSPSRRGYIDELSLKYKLIIPYSNSKQDIDQSLTKSAEILQTLNIKTLWQQRRQQMLAEKININAFMVWFIENYPESV